MKDRGERVSRQFKRRARRDSIEDVLNVIGRAFVIQDIEASPGQGESPAQHLGSERDGLFVGLERFFETIELAKFTCKPKMDQGISGVDSRNTS